MSFQIGLPRTGHQTTSDRTASDQISKLSTPKIPLRTWRSGWTWKSRANALPLTKHSSSESHGLRPNIKTQTGHASSDLTSQLRLVSFGQDLQVQCERPQSQTRHPRSSRIPTQIQRPRTGHPCSNRTVTASGQTYKLTPDMRLQPGPLEPDVKHQDRQPQAGHSSGGRTLPDQKSRLRPVLP